MVNIQPTILNKIPLPYTGNCLFGLYVIAHHPGILEVDPFKGLIKMSQGCTGAMCIKAFMMDEDAKHNNWRYVNKMVYWKDNYTEDVRKYGYEGITEINEYMPDVMDERYWKVGLATSIYNNCKTWYNGWSYGCGGQYVGGDAQGGLPVHLAEPYWVPLKHDRDHSDIITNSTYLLNSYIYRGKSDHTFKFLMPGADGIPVRRHYYALNFDLDLYKTNHPDLYSIYYILYNPDQVNNIGFSPIARRDAC